MTMEASDLAAALGRLAGTERLLVYDVSEPEAPERRNPVVPFVRGGGAWWRFVERRRALDDGADLNLLVSLRGLRADERLLAVSWGCAFANSFLVVEPSDPWLDLTTPEGIADFQVKTGLDDAEKKCEEQHGDDAELNRSSAALPCLVPGKFPAAQHDFPLSVHM